MSDQMIVVESYGSVLADDTVPCVIVQFHSLANKTQLKHIMNSGLAYYQAHSNPARPWGWVGDTRTMAAIPKEVQQWLTDDWNLRAYAAGIREISIVVAQNVLGQIATQQCAQQTVAKKDSYAIVIVYYESIETAKAGAAQRWGPYARKSNHLGSVNSAKPWLVLLDAQVPAYPSSRDC